ncbi:MAG: hypothetical protein MUD14_00645 [Hydrococcus sp. Prado102]|jgi:hypothetical protein|nr:hypothetical protein [Hydrococcus sp. Prado102]
MIYWFDRHRIKQLYILFLLTIFAIAILILGISAWRGNSPDLIVSDGNGYYAWIRSIFIDGDINFQNDFEKLYFPDPPPIDLNRRTPNGLVPNQYPIGVAILEIPGFLLGHVVALLTPFEADGISLPYQISIAFSLVIFILFSFYLFFLALRNYGIQEEVNLLVSSLPLVGTNLLHYVTKEPAMAHGAGVALINCLIFIASYKPGFIKYPFLSKLFTGLIIGLTLIVRLSNLVFLPFFILLFQSELKNWKKLLPFALGIGIMLLLQQTALFLLWGEFVANSYQGKGFTGGAIGLFEIVLGNSYGVFLYHPWYLILIICNVIGLVRLKKQRSWYVAIILGTASLWLINGLWGFSGDSFGSRAFIELLPPLSLGAGITLSWLMSFRYQTIRLLFVTQAIVLIVLNFYLWGGYLLQKYPQNGDRTIVQAYLWILH